MLAGSIVTLAVGVVLLSLVAGNWTFLLCIGLNMTLLVESVDVLNDVSSLIFITVGSKMKLPLESVESVLFLSTKSGNSSDHKS